MYVCTNYLEERKSVGLYVRDGTKNYHYLAWCVYQGGVTLGHVGTVTVCCTVNVVSLTLSFPLL
jgi:hypothetical protein